MTLERKGKTDQMTLIDEGCRDLRIAYIGGGSRGWAPGLMADLLLCPHFTGEMRLYDIDQPMAELNARYGNWIQGHPDARSQWRYRVCTSLAETLSGADFVFLSIQPGGGIELMKPDLEEPKRYGIFQPVGDTVGPGGCVRALRAVADYALFAEAIGEYAPEAWCINFTNPMSVCTRTLHSVFPDIKAYGCCHEVFGTQSFLGDIYKKMTGESKPGRQDMQVNVLGINHFTWVDQAQCRGQDVLALLHDYCQRPQHLLSAKAQEAIADRNFCNHNQVALDLFRRFGVLGAAGDRHLAEFVPWYLQHERSCLRWGFTLTPYTFRARRQRSAPKALRKQLESGTYPEFKQSSEEYINQMLALTGMTQGLRTNVNLPNRGQMGQTPAEVVVETNALFSHNSIEPLASGCLPGSVNALVQRHISNQETLVEAGLSNDPELAFQAFLSDPLCQRLETDQAWRLFTSMCRKTGVSLPGE